jgi:hypothetical protein
MRDRGTHNGGLMEELLQTGGWNPNIGDRQPTIKKVPVKTLQLPNQYKL